MWSPGREVGGVTVVVVVWTDLLHQLVVSAVEGDEYTDDFEGFRAQPGYVALGLLLWAALRWIVGTQWVPGALLYLFILNPAVEQLSVFGLQGCLLLLVMVVVLLMLVDLELHCFGWRDESHWHVTLAGWVVPEVDTKRAIAVVNNFTSDEKVELYCLDVGMEISPTKHLLKLPRLDNGSSFGPWSRVAGAWSVVKPAPLLLFGERVCFVVVQIHRGEILFAVETLRKQAADGESPATLSPVGLHFGFWAIP